MPAKSRIVTESFRAKVSRVVTNDMVYLRREQAGSLATRYVLLADQVKGLDRHFHELEVGTEFLVTVDSNMPKVILEAVMHPVNESSGHTALRGGPRSYRAAAAGQRRLHQ